LNKCTSDIATQ